MAARKGNNLKAMNSEFLFNLHLFHFYSCQKSFWGDSTSSMLKTGILLSCFLFWTKYFHIEPNMFILVDNGGPSCTIWAPQAAIWLERGNCENTSENPRRIFFISTPIYLSLSSIVWILPRTEEEYNHSGFSKNSKFDSKLSIAWAVSILFWNIWDYQACKKERLPNQGNKWLS